MFNFRHLRLKLDNSRDTCMKITMLQVNIKELNVFVQILSEKESSWRMKVESLQSDLNKTLESHYHNANLASMSRSQLEQEIASLKTVIELRGQEIREARTQNQELTKKLERHYWLEKELEKARQRVEEMNLVVQNKMLAERYSAKRYLNKFFKSDSYNRKV